MPAKRTTLPCKSCKRVLPRDAFRPVQRPDAPGTRPDDLCFECRAEFDIERSKRHRVNSTVLCGCGCGKPTKIATRDWPEFGHVKGEPMRFLRGHNARSTPYPDAPYIVDPVTQCWIWQFGLDKDGYGRLWRDGRNQRAHRVYFEGRYGPLPEGMVSDHCCPFGPNTSCVNPDHLRPLTLEDNSRYKSSTRLTPQIAAEIRALKGIESQYVTAERFGIGQSHVSAIQAGDHWPGKDAA